jgi:hypothetical protein
MKRLFFAIALITLVLALGWGLVKANRYQQSNFKAYLAKAIADIPPVEQLPDGSIARRIDN